MLNERSIIYEDQDLVILNKPAGILTVPTPKKEHHTLTNLLNEFLRRRGNADIRAYPCHRLDRDTSGLIIYAKSKHIQQAVMEQFKHGQVQKAYVAFVRGELKRPVGILSFPIESKKAITKYKLLQRRRGYSIIEARPTTGRTNQIRIHCAMIGHPLLGERQFAFGRDFSVKFHRVALHASRLALPHPRTGGRLELHCPLPDDMSKLCGGQIK